MCYAIAGGVLPGTYFPKAFCSHSGTGLDGIGSTYSAPGVDVSEFMPPWGTSL